MQEQENLSGFKGIWFATALSLALLLIGCIVYAWI